MRWIVLVLALAVVSCEGPTGPEGDMGIRGEPGPGTREVVTGTATSDVGVVALPPGLDMDDPPIVQCWRVDPDGVTLISLRCTIAPAPGGGQPAVLFSYNGTPYEYRVVFVY